MAQRLRAHTITEDPISVPIDGLQPAITLAPGDLTVPSGFCVPVFTHTHKSKRNLKNKHVPCSGSNPASKEYQRQLALANTGMYTCTCALTTQVSLKENIKAFIKVVTYIW